MGDRSRDASALLGMEGFVVLSQTEEDGECWVLVETTRDVAGCPSCGVRATGHGRSVVQSHCQELWTRNLTQAAKDPSSVSVPDAPIVVASLLSCSLPSMKVAPARTRGTSSAPVILRQRAWAESSSQDGTAGSCQA